MALQIFHPALQLGVFAATSIQPLLGHRQLVTHITGVPSSALARRLARLARYQTQAIPGHGLGGRRLLRLAPGGIQLLSQRHGATAITPIGILRGDLVNGLGMRQLHALARVRQAQHLTGFKTVDIAVDEGIRVQGLNRQHGLLHRAAIACLGGDFPQGVTGRRGVLRWLCRFRRRSRRRSSRLGRELCRIEQHAVVAHQAAVGPHHLHQELNKRFGQRLAGSHAQHALAISVDHWRETQIIQVCRAWHACLAELLLRGKAGHHLCRGQILNVQQLDFCKQWLVLGRLKRQFPEPKRVCHTG